MKKFKTIIALILLISLGFGTVVYAHSGRAASDGCHSCYTNCSSYGVPYNQKHCHSERRNGTRCYLHGILTGIILDNKCLDASIVFKESADWLCKNSYGIFSEYNSKTKKCQCLEGYTFNGVSCIPNEFVKKNRDICKRKFGEFTKYDLKKHKCQCLKNYIFDGKLCVKK